MVRKYSHQYLSSQAQGLDALTQNHVFVMLACITWTCLHCAHKQHHSGSFVAVHYADAIIDGSESASAWISVAWPAPLLLQRLCLLKKCRTAVLV